MAETTKIRVTNITRQTQGGNGKILDPGDKFGNRLISSGHSMTFDCIDGVMPDCVSDWLEKNFVRVHNASDGTLVAGPSNGEITATSITPAREVVASKFDKNLDDEENFDLDDALEATLPDEITKPISGDLRQQSVPKTRARVSLGTREEKSSGSDLSPIPGDRPRSVDDSEQFTIKAPRSHAVGSVVK